MSDGSTREVDLSWDGSSSPMRTDGNNGPYNQANGVSRHQKDLLQWADSRAAQADLPRLIRRVILETGSGVVSLGVPAGEGVGTGGWDGVARATGATAHVPKGLSVWELSVHKSPGLKADGDYGKRTASPDGSPTTDCTYVQVSGRRWKDRESWAKDRSDEKRWAEVRAYGVDDLEAWLETAPVTWAWISEKLGLHPSGMRSAEYWWDAWSANTTPTTPADLVLAGRTPQAQALRERLQGPGQTTTISASSSEEVLAFIAAVGIEQDVTGTSPLLAQMAFVDDLQAWRRLIAHTKPLILVPRADVEDGYFVEVLGRRGVTSRGLEDGGEQERALVDRYRADVERSANQWPRTAAILRKIVKSYESEARRKDESAERFRRGLER